MDILLYIILGFLILLFFILLVFRNDKLGNKVNHSKKNEGFIDNHLEKERKREMFDVGDGGS